MGITAENVSEDYGITREMQDAWSAQSQQRAEAAQRVDRFKEEIVPVNVKNAKKKLFLIKTSSLAMAQLWRLWRNCALHLRRAAPLLPVTPRVLMTVLRPLSL